MENKCAVIQCGAPFLYKKIYFTVPNRLTPNTWNFIIGQNMKNPGRILLSTLDNEKIMKDCVWYHGSEPINYSKLCKIRRRRIPVYRSREYIVESSSDSDTDDDLYR
jgi:hypothetical protein